jgi:hypothetical protein
MFMGRLLRNIVVFGDYLCKLGSTRRRMGPTHISRGWGMGGVEGVQKDTKRLDTD